MNTDKIVEIKRLEDLIISILLSKNEVITTKNGRVIEFEIVERKYPILKNYLQTHNLGQHIDFDKSRKKFQIKPSIILERILNDWTVKGRVCAINPYLIRTNTYLLWICLFAKKTERNVVIDTKLDIDQQNTISALFTEHFSSSLLSKGDFFHIASFHDIVISSIKFGRPVTETVELNYLLPEKDKKLMKKELVTLGGY